MTFSVLVNAVMSATFKMSAYKKIPISVKHSQLSASLTSLITDKDSKLLVHLNATYHQFSYRATFAFMRVTRLTGVLSESLWTFLIRQQNFITLAVTEVMLVKTALN